MKTYGQSILLLLLLLQAAQATMVITFGVPVTKVNGNSGSYYNPGDTIGLSHRVAFGNGSGLGSSFVADIGLFDLNDAAICTVLTYTNVVSANSTFEYDPAEISGVTVLGSFHTAHLWGSYWDIYDSTWHLMNSDEYGFTQGM